VLSKFRKFQDSFSKRGWFLNENVLYFVKRFKLMQRPFFKSLRLVLNEVYPRDVAMRVFLFDEEDSGSSKIMFWYGHDNPKDIMPMYNKLDKYWYDVALKAYVSLKISDYADVMSNALWCALDGTDASSVDFDDEIIEILEDF